MARRTAGGGGEPTGSYQATSWVNRRSFYHDRGVLLVARLAEGGVSQLARKRERGQIVGINQTDSARITHPLRERIVCSLRGFEGVAASMYVGAKYLSRLTSLIAIVAETPMKISYACLADKSAGRLPDHPTDAVTQHRPSPGITSQAH